MPNTQLFEISKIYLEILRDIDIIRNKSEEGQDYGTEILDHTLVCSFKMQNINMTYAKQRIFR